MVKLLSYIIMILSTEVWIITMRDSLSLHPRTESNTVTLFNFVVEQHGLIGPRPALYAG